MAPPRQERRRRLFPFHAPEARRLAALFGVVYFAQGMWSLPNQTITISFKDLGFSAGQVATFFTLTTWPWWIKPAYGLLSDFVPLFGRRRKSYFLCVSAAAAAAGAAPRPAPQARPRHGAGTRLQRRADGRPHGGDRPRPRAHRGLPGHPVERHLHGSRPGGRPRRASWRGPPPGAGPPGRGPAFPAFPP